MKSKAFILIRFFAPVINLLTDIINVFIWRDKRIVLFGSWMGNRFADNSRYLFQCLSTNKEKYHLKKVIWVTRNKIVYTSMKKQGYEVYMMHSLKSIYFHFKSGIHMVCNQSYPVRGYAGDIMGQFSGHATKINMWHGVPIKAGKSTGTNIKKGFIGKARFFLKTNKIFNFIFSPGHWDRALYFSTGEECTKRLSIFCGIKEKQFIDVGYPRDCVIDKYSNEERKTINNILSHDRSILYVPTFREYGEVPHPLEEESVWAYVNRNDVLWIEKPHSASKNQNHNKDCKNVLYLDGDFDINTILPYITLVITDYSSVCYDAMAFDKPTFFFDSDYDHYLYDERGFLCDYKNEVEGVEASTSSELVMLIEKYFEDERYRTYVSDHVEKVKKLVLSKNKKTIDEIIKALYDKGIMA